ncbi:MAG: Maf family protein [Spirochaetia bacterium]|nr:Maf family protein [Spirochaetia bacterium]
MKPIILASASPRRKELLEKIGLKFTIISSDYVEDMKSNTENLTPEEMAKFISNGKAHDVAVKAANKIVIAADTLVVLNEELLGKPYTKDAAKIMLQKISGQKIHVITGFTIIDTSDMKKISEAVITRVFIKNLSQEEIQFYVNTEEPLDKAGAFAIQGLGALIVHKIEGDFFNVVGMPLFKLAESLKIFNIDVFSIQH